MANESPVGRIWSRHHYSISDISQYDTKPAPFLVSFVPFLRLNGVRVIVDAGCGQGRNLLYLLQHGFNAIGIDASRNAIALTKELLKEQGQGVQLIEANLETTGLDSNSIGAVVSVTVLTHFTNPLKILDEICRILKPGGAICLRILQQKGTTLIQSFPEAEKQEASKTPLLKMEQK